MYLYSCPSKYEIADFIKILKLCKPRQMLSEPSSALVPEVFFCSEERERKKPQEPLVVGASCLIMLHQSKI